MPSQSALQVKGARDVRGIQMLLQQLGSSSQRQLPQQQPAEQGKKRAVQTASDGSDGWTLLVAAVSLQQAFFIHEYISLHSKYPWSSGGPPQEEDQNQPGVRALSSSSYKGSLGSGSLPAESDPFSNPTTHPAPASPVASEPTSAAAASPPAVLPHATLDALPPSRTPGATRPVQKATQNQHPDVGPPSTSREPSAQLAPARTRSNPLLTHFGGGLDSRNPSQDGDRLQDGVVGRGSFNSGAAHLTPPHAEDIAVLQRQLQQLHSCQTRQLQWQPPQQQQQQMQQQSLAGAIEDDRGSDIYGSHAHGHAFGRDHPKPMPARNQGQPEFSSTAAAVNRSSVERRDLPQQQQQQQVQQQHRQSASPLPAAHHVQGGLNPSLRFSHSPSPGPRAVSDILNAQSRAPGAEGRSPAQGSMELLSARSARVHAAPLSTHLNSFPAPQDFPARDDGGPALMGHSRASPQAQPSSSHSPSPSPRVSVGPAAGPPADARRASPFMTSPPSPSGMMSALPRSLPGSHPRASPNVHQRTLLSSEAEMPDRMMPYAGHGASPPSPHAERRASPPPRAERRANPLPVADCRASPFTDAERRASPSRAEQSPTQSRASPEGPKALPVAPHEMSPPVSQMIVLPSQLKVSPGVVLHADQVRLQGAASTAPSPGDLLDQPQLGALAPSGPAARATSSSPGENVGSGSPGAGGEDDAPSTSGQAPGVHTDEHMLPASTADAGTAASDDNTN
ncbi:hypothetical protein ABBQ32_004779 [Trebouxia sp. C0010 RCD-2024]